MKKLYIKFLTPLCFLLAFIGNFNASGQGCTLSPPYLETFSTTSPTSSCWTITDQNNDGNSWIIASFSFDPLIGDRVASMLTEFDPVTDDYLISPTLVASGNEQIRFSCRVQSMSAPNDFEVLLSTSGTAVNNFTNTLIPQTFYDNPNYREYIVDLSGYTGNVNIAFHINDFAYTGWIVGIDKFIFETIPSCQIPTNLTATNISTYNAILNWEENGSAAVWDIEWGVSGFTPSGIPSISATNSKPYPLNGLSPNTTYDYYLRSSCGTSSSDWQGPYTFKTTCMAAIPPFQENFNTFLPNTCWRDAVEGTLAAGPILFESGKWTGKTTLGTTAAVRLYSLGAYNYWLVTPPIDLSAGNYEVSVDAAVTAYNSSTYQSMGSGDTVKVVYTEDGQNWLPLIIFSKASVLNNVLRPFSALIPSTGAHVQFALFATHNDAYAQKNTDIHFDNFKIDHPTGVDENPDLKQSIHVFPNPTNGLFHLICDSEENFSPLSIKVMNLQGQVVFKQLDIQSHTNIIDLSDQAKGIYFVVVTTNQSIVTQKIIVE
ncbi:MAG: choice-of-anchor J domain-containing protein [Flavobacteriales bacterium]|nr:choice-of-anchor J domain-containing protein [Flavobacteriales bacterium]